jgi:hypothetical protein
VAACWAGATAAPLLLLLLLLLLRELRVLLAAWMRRGC